MKKPEMNDIILVDEGEVLEAELADARDRAAREAEAPARALANLLLVIRAEHNLTQEQLAEGIGMTESQISRPESGESGS